MKNFRQNLALLLASAASIINLVAAGGLPFKVMALSDEPNVGLALMNFDPNTGEASTRLVSNLPPPLASGDTDLGVGMELSAVDQKAGLAYFGMETLAVRHNKTALVEPPQLVALNYTTGEWVRSSTIHGFTTPKVVNINRMSAFADPANGHNLVVTGITNATVEKSGSGIYLMSNYDISLAEFNPLTNETTMLFNIATGLSQFPPASGHLIEWMNKVAYNPETRTLVGSVFHWDVNMGIWTVPKRELWVVDVNGKKPIAKYEDRVGTLVVEWDPTTGDFLLGSICATANCTTIPSIPDKYIGQPMGLARFDPTTGEFTHLYSNPDRFTGAELLVVDPASKHATTVDCTPKGVFLCPGSTGSGFMQTLDLVTGEVVAPHSPVPTNLIGGWALPGDS